MTTSIDESQKDEDEIGTSFDYFEGFKGPEIDDLSRRPPPARLFHYTTLKAAIEIIRGKKLWATDAAYLNDSQELEYGLALADDEANIFSRSKSEVLKKLWDDSKTVVSRGRVFIASFSTERDDLSQWRAYSDNGIGVAIGISPRSFKEGPFKRKVVLVECVYDEPDQRSIFRNIFAGTMDWYRRISQKPGTNQTILDIQTAIQLQVHATFAAAAMKHPSFRAEGEWRVTTRLLEAHHEALRVRAVGSSLRPYVELPIQPAPDETAFPTVVLGPGPHSDLNRRALADLLSRSSPPSSEIALSEIPYHTW